METPLVTRKPFKPEPLVSNKKGGAHPSGGLCTSHTQAYSLALSHTHTHTHTVSYSLKHTLSQTLTLSLSLCLYVSLSLSLFLSLTHTVEVSGVYPSGGVCASDTDAWWRVLGSGMKVEGLYLHLSFTPQPPNPEYVQATRMPS